MSSSLSLSVGYGLFFDEGECPWSGAYDEDGFFVECDFEGWLCKLYEIEIPEKEYAFQVVKTQTKLWHQNNQLHRTDGPAVEHPDGTKSWYQNGKRHRTDGPAVEYPNGIKYWYQNGQRHRTDGPAVEYPDGTKYWYGAFPGMVEDYKGNEKFHCRGEVYEISKLALLQLDYLESEGVLFSREPLKVVMEDGSEDTVFFYKFKGYNYLPKKKEFSVLSSGDWRKRA
jgi:gamma-glutamylcyclotransferase (GGCT)/AIG2-like uncharacterized protein YtfP